jgi:hypothetical protein
VQISSDAPVSPITDPLSGVGTVPALTLSPVPADFGAVLVGSSNALTVTATDTGQAPVTISSVALGGSNAGDFSVTSDGCGSHTLNPTDACHVALRFTPSATGSRTALLTVVDNAPGHPHTDPLTGTGLVSTSPPPPPSTPALQIVPAIGTPGSTATVTGTGWGPTVAVFWDAGLDGRKILHTTNGSFTIRLYVFRHDFLGPRHVVASDGTHTLQQTFLAVPGTSEPPDFLLRR